MLAGRRCGGETPFPPRSLRTTCAGRVGVTENILSLISGLTWRPFLFKLRLRPRTGRVPEKTVLMPLGTVLRRSFRLTSRDLGKITVLLG